MKNGTRSRAKGESRDVWVMHVWVDLLCACNGGEGVGRRGRVSCVPLELIFDDFQIFDKPFFLERHKGGKQRSSLTKLV